MARVRWAAAWMGIAWLASALPAQAAMEHGQGSPAVWDSVAKALGTTDVFAGGYHRYNLPRKDLTLRLGDVTVAPELALGAWAGFSDDAEHAMVMGDLVLTSAEVAPVLAELDRQGIAVTAIHNHLVGEEPKLAYVHFHAMGVPLDLARRLDRVVALTGTPRPVAPASAVPSTRRRCSWGSAARAGPTEPSRRSGSCSCRGR